jgi:circadian clock protein KaiC
VITGGGLPQGRPTLVCGGTGCGKTLLAMEFLVRGATQFAEPGVFMSFEEKSAELSKNFASLGFDLNELVLQNQLAIDYVHVEPSEIEETGEYDLEGLNIRLGYAIDTIGAKRLVLDTIEALFSGSNEAILRSELRRLFRFLKDKGVTAIVTGEQGERTFTRFGLEEYVADCVIFLNQTVSQQIATRRLRIVKYRGSAHDTNEYPFLIDRQGFSVMPISSLGLNHPASSERVSTGIPQLDTMLSGKGYYRGSSILVTGTAGTGKSSLAAHLSMPPVVAASVACISPLRSRKTRSSATCIPSASIWVSGSIKACSNFRMPVLPCMAWRCIWSSCTGRLTTSSQTLSSSTRSPTWWRQPLKPKSSRCSPA